MKRNLTITIILVSYILFSCKSNYYKEVPYKLVYNPKEIENNLNIKHPIISLDTINEEYEKNLTDREIYLKEKYSIILRIEPSELKNYKFYDFIDKWIGTKYARQGFSSDSMNIAPFVSALYQYTYKKKLPIKPVDIFKSKDINLFTGRQYLQEGDLLFFRYNKDLPITDLGIYLRNNKILVSTQKDGLIISNFNQDYFQLRYISAGRVNLDDLVEAK